MNDSSPEETTEPPTEPRGANGAAPADSGAPEEGAPAEGRPDGSGESSGAADRPAAPAPEASESQIAALRQEAADAKDLARRAQADLANVRRRARNERAEFRSRAIEEIAGALLPVLDDLHRAVAEVGKVRDRWTNQDGAGPEETPETGAAGDLAGNLSANPAVSVVQGLHEGVRLVLRRFQDTFSRQGLREVEALGAGFDPRLHEAVQETPARAGQRDGEVVAVLQRGYLLDGRVIRPATVVVATGSPETEADPKEMAAGDGQPAAAPEPSPASSSPNPPVSEEQARD